LSIKPEERLRHDLAKVCLLTAVNLRIQPIKAEVVGELDEIQFFGGTIPASVSKFYQQDGTSHLAAISQGSQAAHSRLIGRIQADLDRFHQQLIPWTSSNQQYRIGQLAIFEWFQECHFLAQLDDSILAAFKAAELERKYVHVQ
jgi:hypothetical protein